MTPFFVRCNFKAYKYKNLRPSDQLLKKNMFKGSPFKGPSKLGFLFITVNKHLIGLINSDNLVIYKFRY